jgi:hypothetical protein
MRRVGIVLSDTALPVSKTLFDELSCPKAEKLKKQAIRAVSLIAFMTVGFVATNLWCRKGDPSQQLTTVCFGLMLDDLVN